MSKRIVVNAGPIETRVAVQEGNLLTDLYLERHRHRSIVGSVYKGTVTNVLPGMQAAFVSIGLAKDAFLYAGDYTASRGVQAALLIPPTIEDEDPDTDTDVEVDEAEPPRREAMAPIEQVLSRGQDALVQVSKESLGSKGARVTSFISLPGRYLVYMPQTQHVGVSRRIRDDRERDRLRAALRSLSLPPGGFILRTNAEGKGESEFAADVEFLSRLWAQIQTRYEQATPPAALHEEADLTFRVVRDLFSPEVDEFVVDGAEVHAKCLEYVRALVPALEDRVKRYTERAPIFDHYGIEKALRRRVWLKSGGYIVIDHTEALVSIDVNTGKYVGKRDFEQTVLKINMEAVTEVVRQIRLRDLGGIIIIDFIDMEVPEHREQVYKALKRALAEDKARTNVLQISELGLVEMTRKRVRQDLRALLSVTCPTCRGSGVTKSNETLAAEVYRMIHAKTAAESEPRHREIVARVHPDLATYFEEEGREDLARLEAALDVKVIVQPVDKQPHREDYDIRLR